MRTGGLHQCRSDDAASDTDERTAKDLPQGVLPQHHTTRHHTARDEDGERKPPDGIEAEDGRVGNEGAYDASGTCGMHTHFPPDIHNDAGALDEQRNADDGRQEMRYVADGEEVHQAEVATNADNIRDCPLVPLPKLECAPAMNAAINVDAENRQAEGKEIDKGEQPQPEGQRKQIQVGEAEKNQRSDCRVVRRAEYSRKDACYEKNLSHFLMRLVGYPICSRYFATVRRATL